MKAIAYGYGELGRDPRVMVHAKCRKKYTATKPRCYVWTSIVYKGYTFSPNLSVCKVCQKGFKAPQRRRKRKT